MQVGGGAPSGSEGREGPGAVAAGGVDGVGRAGALSPPAPTPAATGIGRGSGGGGDGGKVGGCGGGSGGRGDDGGSG
jgi:hypothetical protein